jgi:molybdopterin-dependent oxidoreductase alpha subunit
MSDPEKPDAPVFEPNDAAAGGWGALHATAKALRQQGAMVKGSRSLLAVNQPDGFDCPGCAWPDPKHTSSFEFCENGAKAVAWETTDKRVTTEFFERWTVTELDRQSDFWLEDQGRLTEPMRYDPATDKYKPIEWNDAFALIGRELRALEDPNQAEFYASGRASNEAAFLYQLFARLYGTNNLPDCSNMCHEPTSVGLPNSMGLGKGTVVLEDFDHADAIFIIGQNPGTNSPRMMKELHAASRRGAPIVVFNPLKERALERFANPQNPIEMATGGSTRIASEYCQIRVGGDVAALKGIMKLVLDADDKARASGQPEVLDWVFIREHTIGFEAFAEDLRQTGWDEILETSGLPFEQLQRVARVYSEAENVIACYGMGVTQHRLGSDNVQQVANLLFLRGNIGRKGSGISPVRGHSNVQGARTVGIDEKPTNALLDQLGRIFDFQPPRAHGHNVVGALHAMLDGTARVFIGLGGNFVAAVPDRPRVEAAMRKLRLTVGVTTKLNRGHLVHGEEALILPCLGRTEIDFQKSGPQSVTVEDSMSWVHASGGLHPPASEQLRSEIAIVCGMARATLLTTKIDWQAFEDDYDLVRNGIEAVFTNIFKDYNKRIRRPGGFRLPNSAGDRIWRTPSGKAQFNIFRGVDENPPVPHPEMLRMATLRSHDQYNTTIYSMDDRYRGIYGTREVVLMNRDDMAARKIPPESLVEIEALAGDGIERRVTNFRAVPYDIPRGSVATYYPETNALIAVDYNDYKCQTPSAKSVPVLVRAMPAVAAD